MRDDPFEPWDGIWTEDLLRDLTRREGPFEVQRYTLKQDGRVRHFRPYGKPVTVEADANAGYLIGIQAHGLADAVKELNRTFAVPLYVTGKEWKVRRPDPERLAAGCPECDGTGYVDCGSCDGTGDCECHCGHQHDCHECDGTGEVACSDCQEVAHA